MIIAAAFVLLSVSHVSAYIGPGAGISLVGWFIGFIVVMGTAFSAVLSLPLHWVWKQIKQLRHRDLPE